MLEEKFREYIDAGPNDDATFKLENNFQVVHYYIYIYMFIIKR